MALSNKSTHTDIINNNFVKILAHENLLILPSKIAGHKMALSHFSLCKGSYDDFVPFFLSFYII